ncbi:hypothetical protein [Devosia rhizoryzae]|uniref:Uncharacterized protein n=1 Tax=Devosia rhizoryzae TaxID=2774137 RepID=A0ABX7CEF0_9HYPH|nr:hypothetical protein [Devosia rhizoryzae]QQR40990.1 hypothetical protein JI748_08445 [Devosia rhizoryzae]
MAEKRREDRGVARIVIIAFVVALIAAIAWVIIQQSGVLPGDTGEDTPAVSTSN